MALVPHRSSPSFKEVSTSKPDPIFLHDRRRDKALLVGLEYKFEPNDEVSEISGVHDDVRKFREHLINHEGYLAENITMLLDDGIGDITGGAANGNDLHHYRLNRPDRNTILREIDRLVEGVKPHDRRLFFFAGHGCQLQNITGSEPDLKDEAVLTSHNGGFPPNDKNGDPTLPTAYPRDIPPNHKHHKIYKGIILDNEFRERLVNPMPDGSQLLAFLETCHSGTLLDLDSKTWKHRLINAVTVGPKARKFVRRQVRRMTMAALFPVALLQNSLHLKPVLWRPPAEEGAVSTPRGNGQVKATSRKSTWDERISRSKQEMTSLGDAHVVSLSSSCDSQKSYSGAKHLSMIAIVMEYLQDKPPAERHLNARDLHTYVCQRMEDERVKLFRSEQGFSRKKLKVLRQKLRDKQAPQLSSLNEKSLDIILEL